MGGKAAIEKSRGGGPGETPEARLAVDSASAPWSKVWLAADGGPID